jgi:hypothetical protein
VSYQTGLKDEALVQAVAQRRRVASRHLRFELSGQEFNRGGGTGVWFDSCARSAHRR